MDVEFYDLMIYDFRDKNVLIIGCPASGKSYLSQYLCNGHVKIHTDNYMHLGYNDSMYAALEQVTSEIGNTLVEGVQGYRMLRKGAQLGTYKPDIVIECVISRGRMEQTYLKERDPKKIKYLRSFNATHQTILNDYYNLVEPNNRPIWLTWNNNY
jgi:hypothetical protein